MGRNFDGTTDKVSLGDISTARFLQASAWTVLVFFRVENTATDDRAIISKWSSGSTGRQFIVRTDAGTAPQEIEVYTDGTIRITGGSNVELDTWYLVAVMNDGADGVGGGLTMVLLGMDETVLDNTTGDHATDAASVTAVIDYGIQGSTSDPMDGDVALGAYIDAELTLQDCKDYLHNPAKVVSRFIGSNSVQFFNPLTGESTEHDWSDKTNEGTLTGTTVGDNPPIGSLYGSPADGPFTVAAGGISYTLAADAGSFSMAGSTMSPILGRKVAADAGAYSMAGQDAGLIWGAKVAADAGAYSLAGSAATLTWAALLDAAAGSYAMSGTDAALLKGYVLAALAGAYDLAGQDAGLVSGQSIAADSGAFSMSGTDAGLVLGSKVAADAGAFSMAGSDAGLAWAALLDAATAAYNMAGQDAGLVLGRSIAADAGAYAMAGQDAGLVLGYIVVAESGAYLFTGTAAGLNFSGASPFVSIEGVTIANPTLASVTILSPTLAVVTIGVPKLTNVTLIPD